MTSPVAHRKPAPIVPATVVLAPVDGSPPPAATPPAEESRNEAPDTRDRQAQIARRALSKAHARGFSGRTLSDWRDAEAEYEAEMAARDWALARDFARSNDLLPRDFRPSDLE